jgi:hypothetical protein
MKPAIDPNMVDAMESMLDAIDELLRALRRANDALSSTDFGNHTDTINKVTVQSRAIKEAIAIYRQEAGEA